VRVSVGETVIAESAKPVMVFETSRRPRAYIPRRDLIGGHLAPSTTRTTCPYKGDATYWHVHADGREFRDAAWSYELPLAEAMKIAGHVGFAAEGITITQEG
jgi:uncharacterized protein (DUF427 family)